MAPSYGWYGDDFTGATDTLATLARRGRRAFLFLKIPEPRYLTQVGDLDAVGIAGAARTMSPEEMRAELEPVGQFFRDLGVKLLHYKCCSTFDSAPQRGNIAAAVSILRPYAAHEAIAVIGGQPSLGRYCSFSNLFATFGADGEVFRLDRHPTMSRHPATPMGEADLRRHLQTLGMADIFAIHWPLLDGDAAAIAAEWQRLSQSSTGIIFDATRAQHLDAVGRLLRERSLQRSLLVVGASSVAQAYFEPRDEVSRVPALHADGPVLAFVGSLSPTTRAQMMAARSYNRISIDANDLMTSADKREKTIERAVATLSQGDHVMVTTVPLEGGVLHAAAVDLAGSSADLVNAILERHPVKRLAIAGGDTSSKIVGRLGFWGLGYHSQISNGVAVSVARSNDAARDNMLVMLKGGQMGHEKLFEAFLEEF